MPLFTKETAGHFGRLGVQARKALRVPPLPKIVPPLPTDEDRRRQRLAMQLDQIDAMMAGCCDRDQFVKLVGAKARLWELLFPKPGSLRPKSSRSDHGRPTPVQPATPPEPQPVADTPVTPSDPAPPA